MQTIDFNLQQYPLLPLLTALNYWDWIINKYFYLMIDCSKGRCTETEPRWTSFLQPQGGTCLFNVPQGSDAMWLERNTLWRDLPNVPKTVITANAPQTACQCVFLTCWSLLRALGCGQPSRMMQTRAPPLSVICWIHQMGSVGWKHCPASWLKLKHPSVFKEGNIWWNVAQCWPVLAFPEILLVSKTQIRCVPKKTWGG